MSGKSWASVSPSGDGEASLVESKAASLSSTPARRAVFPNGTSTTARTGQPVPCVSASYGSGSGMRGGAGTYWPTNQPMTSARATRQTVPDAMRVLRFMRPFFPTSFPVPWRRPPLSVLSHAWSIDRHPERRPKAEAEGSPAGLARERGESTSPLRPLPRPDEG